MNSIRTVLLLLFCAFFTSNSQQPKPEPAQTILSSAIEKAQKSDKNILIIYHATWCGWCAKIDSFLEKPDIKKIFENNFVIVRLDVLERGDKVNSFENPGALQTLINYGGKKSGLPFMVFLDKTGDKIADSNAMPENQNIGYPGSEEEILAFVRVIKQTAPRITTMQLSHIVQSLKENSPK